MRKIVIFMAVSAVLSAFAAEPIRGEYNTSLGYLAGKDADGNRATVMGAGAGGEATNVGRSDFVGAASGIRARNIMDSVAIGYQAMKDATNMDGVVAIGSHALQGASGLNGETYLNGHFRAGGGRFYVKANKAMPDEAAPIYYANGNLYLNADKIITAGGSIVGGGGAAAEEVECDWYVSENGSDEYDGRSRATAFKTIDKAYSVSTNFATIGVLAGRYPFPDAFNWRTPTNCVNIVGLAGRDKTFIEDENGGGFVVCAGLSGSFNLTYWEGFTFVGGGSAGAKQQERSLPSQTGTFTACYFKDCAFKTGNEGSLLIAYVRPFMSYCHLEGCVMDAHLYSTNEVGYSQNFCYNCMFQYVSFVNCEVTLDTENRSGKGVATARPNMGSYIRFDDCFVRTGELNYGPKLYENSVIGRSGITNSTVICEGGGWTRGLYSASPSMNVHDSILGVGDGDEKFKFYTNDTSKYKIVADDCLFASAEEVLAGISAKTHLPIRRSWRWYGYKSGEDREFKNAVVEAVLREITGGAETEVLLDPGGIMLTGERQDAASTPRSVLLQAVEVPDASN